jgi:putative redox protein
MSNLPLSKLTITISKAKNINLAPLYQTNMALIELVRLEGDFGFEAKDEDGHTVKMDSSPQSGGHHFGVRPMQMLLMGLAGCSAIDVITILKKQRQEITDYKMTVSGEREAGKEPSLWKTVFIEFHLFGTIDAEKANKAAELSINKYCSVAATLAGSGTEIKWQVFVYPA